MKKKFSILLFIALQQAIFSQTFSNTDLIKLKQTNQNQVSTSIQDQNLNFSNDFNPNIQIALSNPDYMVTPGDIYSLNYAVGTNPVSYKILVDTSYKIRVSNLAVLDATNKTYMQLKKQVEEIVSKNYPLSGVQFILTSPASFKITVTGCVSYSSEQKAWALTRLSDILQNAPINEYSSQRFVTIKSENKTETVYDLFKTFRNGDYSQNPYIRPGDEISIQMAEKKVSIDGAVIFPGTYELSPNENIKELIENFAGGLTPLADTTRIEISRKISSENSTGEKIYISKKEINENFSLSNLDSIYIESTENLQPRFYVEGAITSDNGLNDSTIPETSSKTSIQFEKGTIYDFIIRKNSKLFSTVSDLENAYIIRADEIIPINIKKIIDDFNYYSNITILENDILRIPFKQFFVTVAGSVINPGRYPYIPDRDYEYYIGLAGGFNKNQNSGKSVKIVDINGKTLNKNSPITPETTITAKTNSFMYYFNQTAPIITTLLTLITTGLSVYAAFGK